AGYTRVRRLIAETRPTAKNLFGTLSRMDRIVREGSYEDRKILLEAIEAEARAIHGEERESCIRIGEHGAGVILGNTRILTHCNTGVLATGGIGTALGVIHTASANGDLERVWVDETRPLLQGARLTAWELHKLGIPHSIICDNTAASLMQRGMVDAVITGADRIAINGDTANKIGTLNLAILCDFFEIPFYIAAPVSTIDFEMESGGEIVVEQRDTGEVHGWGDNKWACQFSDALNPAFDVTPGRLITGIITETGVYEYPYSDSLEGLNIG
ncbi:MAG: S-methyl-5-thioribose-1-phosphate isomerase, partial [bacterium]